MVTSFRMGWIVGLGVVLAACGGRNVDTGAGDPPRSPTTGSPELLPPDTVEPGGTGPQYPGSGFRVHEWGTNTIVVGTDGALQRGLHHEEEDLPVFVYDRHREELAQPADVKMETPVTYFYSDKPLDVTASVSFPKGVLTQWYPAVQAFWPPTIKGKGDPVLDKAYPASTSLCAEDFKRVENGALSWGTVSVLPRGAAPSAPDAPLTRYTWSHARAVDANAVRVATTQFGAQDERFLFYRGLGNFPIDVRITAQAGSAGRDGGLVLANQDAKNPVGAVFVLRVEKDRAAFLVRPAGIPAKGTLEETAPPATQPLDAYAQDLAKAMVAQLDGAGLYHDESVAMVKTWARQWFRTPGVRVLYLAPQAWTDTQIPLEITPKPMEVVRVMVIRVEALTRVAEEADLAAMQSLADPATRAAAQAHFASLGRFAEPRLRRAMAQTSIPTSDALAYLEAISGANVSSRAGE